MEGLYFHNRLTKIEVIRGHLKKLHDQEQIEGVDFS